jgi:hypothetical protein
MLFKRVRSNENFENLKSDRFDLACRQSFSCQLCFLTWIEEQGHGHAVLVIRYVMLRHLDRELYLLRHRGLRGIAGIKCAGQS